MEYVFFVYHGYKCLDTNHAAAYDESEKLYFSHDRWERYIPLKIYIKYLFAV